MKMLSAYLRADRVVRPYNNLPYPCLPLRGRWREAPEGVGALRKHAGGMFSLSKNYPNAPVSAIIEETGVFTWKVGEKTHGMSQSS